MKVVKTLGAKKNFGIEFTEDPWPTSVARIIVDEEEYVTGFVTMDEYATAASMTIDRERYTIEPLFPFSAEGMNVIISGEAGSGKSLMASMLVEQYAKTHPKHRLFLVSEKRKEVDRNLSKMDALHQLSPEEIADFDINNYHDCLFLVDDSDFGKGAKAVFELLNLISTVGREYKISIIFVTHFNSRLNATLIYREFHMYITFHNNLVNNRLLYHHMGISPTQIQEFVKMRGSFYCFNRIFRVLITDETVQKY